MNFSSTPRYIAHASWAFYNPVKLNVGRGCRSRLVEKLRGKTILVVTTQRGRRQFSEDSVLSELITASKIEWVDTVTENPGLLMLQADIDRLKHAPHYDAAVAFGGGSAMDAAKSINTALAKECQELTLAELLSNPSIHANASPKPLYTIATTAGTGSEVTPFATVWDHEKKRKLSLSSPAVWPTEAFVDADLTDSVPLEATISTGLDALNQAAESVWNKNANSITLAYATRALRLGFDALPKLAAGQGAQVDRDKMVEASVLAGLAISHTRTALCHSISYPLTAHFRVPHGLACAFTMPYVLVHNLTTDDGRFKDLSLALTGSEDCAELVKCFETLHELLDVRNRVKKIIPSLDNLLLVESEMHTPGRSDNNLVYVENVEDLLRRSWG
jgi:alcohol dehydrogenase